MLNYDPKKNKRLFFLIAVKLSWLSFNSHTPQIISVASWPGDFEKQNTPNA